MIIVSKPGAPAMTTQTYCPDGATTVIDFTGTSQQSAVLVASNTPATLFQLYASADCHIAFGVNPTAVNSGASRTMQLKAGIYLPVDVLPGYRIAVIQAGAAGTLYITPCTV